MCLVSDIIDLVICFRHSDKLIAHFKINKIDRTQDNLRQKNVFIFSTAEKLGLTDVLVLTKFSETTRFTG